MKNLKIIEKHLNETYVERKESIRLAILAMISQSNMLLIGPPGVAKSAMVQDLANSVIGANYFNWLLTKYSTPEELFGPVLLAQLEKGIYERNVSHKLPEAHIAFLDECFKANSAILNSLLTIINERIYHNNGSPVNVPLLSLYGASNEYPEEDSGLEALYDRFLIRYEVEPVGQLQNFNKMIENAANSVLMQQKAGITLEELMNIQQLASLVVLSRDVLAAIGEVKQDLKALGIHPTDRRWVQSLCLVKANACYKGKQTADVSDLGVLKHVLWADRKDIKAVAETVVKHTTDQMTSVLEQLTKEATEAAENALNTAKGGDPSQATQAGQEASVKLKGINKDLAALCEKYPDKKDLITGYTNAVSAKLTEVYRECLGIVL